MVAAHLIVRAPIGRPQVERIVGLHVFLHPERDPHEAARPFAGIRPRRAGNLGLDHPVRKLDILNHRDGVHFPIRPASCCAALRLRAVMRTPFLP